MAESEKKITPEEMLEFMESELKPVEHPGGIEMREWAFSNDPTNPMPRHLFHLFMKGAFANKIGIMNAKLKGTDEIHSIVVGVQINEDGTVATWPLAKIFDQEEQDLYAAPDGEGNYIE
jgi:hypothetical protein